MLKVCRDNMPCEVKKNTIWCSFGGGLKKWKISLRTLHQRPLEEVSCTCQNNSGSNYCKDEQIIFHFKLRT